MRKLRIVLVLLAAALTAPVCAAQGEKERDEPGRPDLSGEWVLDRARSFRTDYDISMTVVHRGPEMRVKKRMTKAGREWVEECAYYTDGRKEQKAELHCRDSESLTAQWRGRKLVRRSRRVTKGVMKIDMIMSEEWELSVDGKTLTRTVTNMEALSTNERLLPIMRTKYVYTRAS